MRGLLEAPGYKFLLAYMGKIRDGFEKEIVGTAYHPSKGDDLVAVAIKTAEKRMAAATLDRIISFPQEIISRHEDLKHRMGLKS